MTFVPIGHATIKHECAGRQTSKSRLRDLIEHHPQKRGIHVQPLLRVDEHRRDQAVGMSEL